MSHGSHSSSGIDKEDGMRSAPRDRPNDDEAMGQSLHSHHGTHGEQATQPKAEHRAAHGEHAPQPQASHGGGHHGVGGVSHVGHELMFRRRFWVCLALSVPVLVWSQLVQRLFGYTAPAFAGSAWIAPLLSVVIFFYGGVPFLRLAVPELQARRPGMMTLISLAISVAFLYSLASLFIVRAEPFFWELVTLIDIMLLGHWLEMRSVRQASGALQALARLMPDTAELVSPGGTVETVPVSQLYNGDL